MSELPSAIDFNEVGYGLREGVVKLGVDLGGRRIHDHALGLGFYERLELCDTVGESGVLSC